MSRASLNASEIGRVTDVMAKSFSASALDVESLPRVWNFLAPVARASGVSYEQSTAMLAVLSDNMISGRIASTSQRRIMTDIGRS